MKGVRTMKLGFIGLGIMGKPMTENLLKAGYQVTVFDINRDAVDYLQNKGALPANNPGDVAAKSDVIFTMLPNSTHVEEVVTGTDGLIHRLHSDHIVVDLSSISPVMSRKLHARLQEIEAQFIDAPVSGGEPKAIDGTLSIMAGGEEAAFNKVKPILDRVAGSVILVGETGAGTTTKLANQIIVNANIAAMSEAVNLASEAGIDIEKMFQAVRGGLAGSAVLEAKIPLILEENFKAGGRIDINAKDLTNVVETGETLNVPLPVTNQVLDMFKELVNDGKAELDHAGLLKYYEKHTPLQKG
ncbi:2-hydroxy-3-oxopropionate reductase [Thalassorhabdus alkalitolerans]|uniref:2-hydroxy-3-oxopropionate reductase n=1 Tax=Thalassorhabdus alkalitolerans TaxID=2282697 RepID=A0ABW0YSZ1_9BACI